MNTILSKKLLAVLLALCQAAFLFAQERIIKGKVTNGYKNLHAATVSLGNKTVLTNIAGEFTFSAKHGDYLLTITHAGYKKIEAPVSVIEGSREAAEMD